MIRIRSKQLLLILLALAAVLPVMAGAEKASAKKGVEELLNMQVEAWNRGDIDTFMKGYLQSPTISYTSGGVEVWGYEALLKRYQSRYGTKQDTMGKLSFSDLKISELGADHAMCIGHWHLVRDSQPNVDGTFTLVFVRSGAKWKIIHDHTSALQKQP